MIHNRLRPRPTSLSAAIRRIMIHEGVPEPVARTRFLEKCMEVKLHG